MASKTPVTVPRAHGQRPLISGEPSSSISNEDSVYGKTTNMTRCDKIKANTGKIQEPFTFSMGMVVDANVAEVASTGVDECEGTRQETPGPIRKNVQQYVEAKDFKLDGSSTVPARQTSIQHTSTIHGEGKLDRGTHTIRDGATDRMKHGSTAHQQPTKAISEEDKRQWHPNGQQGHAQGYNQGVVLQSHASNIPQQVHEVAQQVSQSVVDNADFCSMPGPALALQPPTNRTLKRSNKLIAPNATSTLQGASHRVSGNVLEKAHILPSLDTANKVPETMGDLGVGPPRQIQASAPGKSNQSTDRNLSTVTGSTAHQYSSHFLLGNETKSACVPLPSETAGYGRPIENNSGSTLTPTLPHAHFPSSAWNSTVQCKPAANDSMSLHRNQPASKDKLRSAAVNPQPQVLRSVSHQFPRRLIGGPVGPKVEVCTRRGTLRSHADKSSQTRRRCAPWSDDEDKLLTELVRELGPSWPTVAERIPNRSPSGTRNRWQKLIKQKGSENMFQPASQKNGSPPLEPSSSYKRTGSSAKTVRKRQQPAEMNASQRKKSRTQAALCKNMVLAVNKEPRNASEVQETTFQRCHPETLHTLKTPADICNGSKQKTTRGDALRDDGEEALRGFQAIYHHCARDATDEARTLRRENVALRWALAQHGKARLAGRSVPELHKMISDETEFRVSQVNSMADVAIYIHLAREWSRSKIASLPKSFVFRIDAHRRGLGTWPWKLRLLQDLTIDLLRNSGKVPPAEAEDIMSSISKDGVVEVIESLLSAGCALAPSILEHGIIEVFKTVLDVGGLHWVRVAIQHYMLPLHQKFSSVKGRKNSEITRAINRAAGCALGHCVANLRVAGPEERVLALELAMGLLDIDPRIATSLPQATMRLLLSECKMLAIQHIMKDVVTVNQQTGRASSPHTQT